MSIMNKYQAEYQKTEDKILVPEEEGRKFDQNKADYSLMPSHAEEQIVDVLTYGAKKYDRENWRKVPDAKNRYYAAARRHIEQWRRGETQDEETGKSHLAHAACCLLFLMELDKEI